MTLTQLAFDGTRMRVNSRRSGTRKVADLAESLAALAAKFAELQAKAEAQDAAVCASALTVVVYFCSLSPLCV